MVLRAIAPWLSNTPEQKEALFRQAVLDCPSSEFAREHLASHLCETGKTEQGIEEYRKLLEAAPHCARTRFALAGQLAQLERWQDALDVASEHAATPNLRACRGLCLAELGRIDDAKMALDSVLRDDPRNYIALDALATVEAARGNKHEAAGLRRKARYHAGGS